MSKPTLQQSHGPQYTRILSVGAARGDLLVPNSELIGPIDSSDEWIQQRTGIITRSRASQDIDTVDLATDAAREAIERSGIDPALIDTVIVATISNARQTPSVAAVVADRLARRAGGHRPRGVGAFGSLRPIRDRTQRGRLLGGRCRSSWPRSHRESNRAGADGARWRAGRHR